MDAVKKLQRWGNKMAGYTETELKVLDATNEENEECNRIMAIIWKRMEESGRNWRLVYKALTLLEYLLRNGSEQVADMARDHIFAIRTLKEFQYANPETGKDEGINVRERAKQLAELIMDDQHLKEERKKAEKTRSKYVGFSQSDGQGHVPASQKKYTGFSSDDYFAKRQHERAHESPPRDWEREKKMREEEEEEHWREALARRDNPRVPRPPSDDGKAEPPAKDNWAQFDDKPDDNGWTDFSAPPKNDEWAAFPADPFADDLAAPAKPTKPTDDVFGAFDQAPVPPPPAVKTAVSRPAPAGDPFDDGDPFASAPTSSSPPKPTAKAAPPDPWSGLVDLNALSPAKPAQPSFHAVGKMAVAAGAFGGSPPRTQVGRDGILQPVRANPPPQQGGQFGGGLPAGPNYNIGGLVMTTPQGGGRGRGGFGGQRW